MTTRILRPFFGFAALALTMAACLPAQERGQTEVPATLATFIENTRGAHRAGPAAFKAFFRGADEDIPASGTAVRTEAAPVWSELSPVVMRIDVSLVTSDVAMIEAEVGQYSSAGGWRAGTQYLIVVERRGRGASERWQPVLVRTFRSTFLDLPPVTRLI